MSRSNFRMTAAYTSISSIFPRLGDDLEPEEFVDDRAGKWIAKQTASSSRRGVLSKNGVVAPDGRKHQALA